MKAEECVLNWNHCNHKSSRKHIKLESLQPWKQPKACQIGIIATMEAAESVSNWKHCNHGSRGKRAKLESLQPWKQQKVCQIGITATTEAVKIRVIVTMEVADSVSNWSYCNHGSSKYVPNLSYCNHGSSKCHGFLQGWNLPFSGYPLFLKQVKKLPPSF